MRRPSVLLAVLASLLVVTGSAQAAPRALPKDPVPLIEMRTTSNSLFYTLDPAEADVAATRHGFTVGRPHVAYLPAVGFDGAVPLYRLRARSRAAYLVTPSTDERDALVASGEFVYERVLGYAWKDAGRGRERLWRVSNGQEWRLLLERDVAEYQRRGYKVDGPVGYVDPRYIRAGAIYFGRYDAQATDIIDAAARTFGRQGDWWGGVRDYSGQDPRVPVFRGAWPDTDFSHLAPAIGFYDDADPATLAKHITQATSAGLRYFSFYYYWNSRTGQELLNGGLRAFLQAGNRKSMDFGIQLCSHPWDDRLRIPREQFPAVTGAIANNYLSQENYVRANDGRPIVWLCDTRGLGDGSAADVRAFIDQLRGRASEPILVIANRDLTIDRAAASIDGQFCSARFDGLDRSYRRYVETQRALFAGDAPVYQRCVMSNFDERPRYPMAIADPQQARWFPDQTKALFAQAARNVRDDIAASTRPQAIDNFALVYAWNEWEEGGIVEPSLKEGCAYLDILRADLELRNGDGCIANPASPQAAPAGSPSAAASPTRPSIARLRVTPSRFAVRRPKGTGGRSARRVSTGTTIRYVASRRARVHLTVARAKAGLRVGKRCRRATRQLRRRLARSRPCDLPVGTLGYTAKAGPNAARFSGRLGRRSLARGRYVVTAVAHADGLRSVPRSARFRVVRRGRR